MTNKLADTAKEALENAKRFDDMPRGIDKVVPPQGSEQPKVHPLTIGGRPVLKQPKPKRPITINNYTDVGFVEITLVMIGGVMMGAALVRFFYGL